MKAIAQHRYGSPDVLSLADIDVPAPADDEVLIRVRSASLNAADLDYQYGRPAFARLLYGLTKPKHLVPGMDVAGTVQSVGRNVTRFKIGDDVLGDLTQSGLGAFAEYVCARQDVVTIKPATLSFDVAATIPQSGIIALQGLRSGRAIRPGDKVLINGASGNVGPFAVQIAKWYGAEVTGVCSTSKIDMVLALGVDHVIDYTKVDVTRVEERYDRILDLTAPHPLRSYRRVLAPGGVYVMAGGSGARIVEALFVGPIVSLITRKKMGMLMSWKPFQADDIAFLLDLVAAGGIAPVIDRRFPLAEVPDALRYLDSRQARGKIVITM